MHPEDIKVTNHAPPDGNSAVVVGYALVAAVNTALGVLIGWLIWA